MAGIRSSPKSFHRYKGVGLSFIAGEFKNLDAARAVVQYWIEYWAIWHRAFPRLHKRAHWHIVVHLCRHAQGGMALGELFGLIRQLLLLEDATVRDRRTAR